MNVDTLTVARLRSLVAAGVLGTAGAFSSLAACEVECETCPKDQDGECVVEERDPAREGAAGSEAAEPAEGATEVAAEEGEEEVPAEDPPVCPGPGDPGWNCPACGMG